jgi:hypothetical protein
MNSKITAGDCCVSHYGVTATRNAYQAPECIEAQVKLHAATQASQYCKAKHYVYAGT